MVVSVRFWGCDVERVGFRTCARSTPRPRDRARRVPVVQPWVRVSASCPDRMGAVDVCLGAICDGVCAVLTCGVWFVCVVQYQHVQGHLVGLLQIIVATHVDLSIRQVASIYFKNVTARDWMPREPGKQGRFLGPL